ncbi:PREDICTED: trimethylguanosine synthase-like [Hipposideros armiger]|uniref:Trimethylguanosine synthase-like n=1 Tax=Hipposideros armiger TaxID=186990 RepID=A0A8B7T319_HIPAR|nr:PREDICTED: trimethylguanosine synthase-like [Hipposideros armiger]
MRRQINMKNKHIFFTEESEKTCFKKSKALSKVEKFLKCVNEQMDEEALQESVSHDSVQDTCTSSDSEQEMSVTKGDDPLEKSNPEPEKCHNIVSVDELETEKCKGDSTVAAVTDKEDCVAQDITDCLQVETEAEIKKKKKKKNKNKKVIGLPPEIAAVPKLAKYWAQRYRLFSRFDDGIKLDRECNSSAPGVQRGRGEKAAARITSGKALEDRACKLGFKDLIISIEVNEGGKNINDMELGICGYCSGNRLKKTYDESDRLEFSLSPSTY